MEFANLGQHCAVGTCHQQDFLPFTCDACNKVFCLGHRTYGTHNCAAAGNKDSRVIVCPLCTKTVKLVPGEDANDTWVRHSKTSCDPTKRKKSRKPRCGAAGCRTKLVMSNKVVCDACGMATCLKHRYSDAHQCPAAGAASHRSAAAAAAARRLTRTPLVAAAPAPSSTNRSRTHRAAAAAAAAAAPATATAASTLRATGARRAVRAAAAAGRELDQCPTCRQSFSDVTQLIAHVESAHSAAAAPATATATAARAAAPVGEAPPPCPHCGKQLADYAALVSHVESHLGSSSSQSQCLVS